MPYYENRSTVAGILTKKPELKESKTGPYCNMLIAVNKNYKEATTGEWKERSHFFYITAFGNKAKYVCDYGEKGSNIVVDAELESKDVEGRGTYINLVAKKVQLVSKQKREENYTDAEQSEE